ncbi:hypothetical protein LAZ67_7002497 [Cordylochernes scorpioides]|uniref:Follistatin n=1 Tax=Cordylochernes scorpioides TaxID=51811 RepID=A0ABY6KN74_9ARAC|nr:hypothetical protein LAZ67_7002497 [Cordylochernes scorpioides]
MGLWHIYDFVFPTNPTRYSNCVINSCDTGCADAKKCDKLCLYGGVCQYNNEGYPQCFCHFHCQPPSAHETICTSEGKQYPSRCFLKKEACRRQKPVKVVPCPAQCATLSPGNVRVNPGWEDSAVTPVSLGTGDYEPKDVYRSVRAECGCSEAGSVREDCDQSTGRCVCRAGVQGRRCNLCPPGSVLLDKWGCKRVVAARNCSELHCGFGARCREKRRRAHCVCDLHCSAEDTRVPVCGADGTTYSSECELRLYRCRHQRAVALLYRGPCTSPVNKMKGFKNMNVSFIHNKNFYCPYRDEKIKFISGEPSQRFRQFNPPDRFSEL